MTFYFHHPEGTTVPAYTISVFNEEGDLEIRTQFIADTSVTFNVASRAIMWLQHEEDNVDAYMFHFRDDDIEDNDIRQLTQLVS